MLRELEKCVMAELKNVNRDNFLVNKIFHILVQQKQIYLEQTSLSISRKHFSMDHHKSTLVAPCPEGVLWGQRNDKEIFVRKALQQTLN